MIRVSAYLLTGTSTVTSTNSFVHKIGTGATGCLVSPRGPKAQLARTQLDATQRPTANATLRVRPPSRGVQTHTRLTHGRRQARVTTEPLSAAAPRHQP